MAQNLQAIVDEQKSQLENYEKKLKGKISINIFPFLEALLRD